MDGKLLMFAVIAGVLSGINLFMHKVAANRLEKTALNEILSVSFVSQLMRNPYLYVVLAMGLLVLAVDLAFLSNEVPAIVGLNLIIVIGNVLFVVLSVLILGEKMDLRIATGIAFGIIAVVLLSRV